LQKFIKRFWIYQVFICVLIVVQQSIYSFYVHAKSSPTYAGRNVKILRYYILVKPPDGWQAISGLPGRFLSSSLYR